MTTWQSFAELGDQFLVAYAQQSSVAPAATLFTVGHAAELYLKATLLRVDPARDIVKRGHQVGAMLREVQSFNPPLLAGFTLLAAVPQKFMTGALIPMSATADPDYAHYVQHQELYWIAAHLVDLKYLGSVHTKNTPQMFAVLAQSTNHYWLNFFGELRAHLNWPACGGGFDYVKQYLAQSSQSVTASRWLYSLDGWTPPSPPGPIP